MTELDRKAWNDYKKMNELLRSVACNNNLNAVARKMGVTVSYLISLQNYFG